jgi:hypothetical protein
MHHLDPPAGMKSQFELHLHWPSFYLINDDSNLYSFGQAHAGA